MLLATEGKLLDVTFWRMPHYFLLICTPNSLQSLFAEELSLCVRRAPCW